MLFTPAVVSALAASFVKLERLSLMFDHPSNAVDLWLRLEHHPTLRHLGLNMTHMAALVPLVLPRQLRSLRVVLDDEATQLLCTMTLEQLTAFQFDDELSADDGSDQLLALKLRHCRQVIAPVSESTGLPGFFPPLLRGNTSLRRVALMLTDSSLLRELHWNCLVDNPIVQLMRIIGLDDEGAYSKRLST